MKANETTQNTTILPQKKVEEPTMTKSQFDAQMQNQSKLWADKLALEMKTFDDKMN